VTYLQQQGIISEVFRWVRKCSFIHVVNSATEKPVSTEV